jgi:hypothetical protein
MDTEHDEDEWLWCSHEHPLRVFEEDRLLRMAAAAAAAMLLLPRLPFKRLQKSILSKLQNPNPKRLHRHLHQQQSE